MPQRMESKGSTDLDTLQVRVLISHTSKSAGAVGSSDAQYASQGLSEAQLLRALLTRLGVVAGAAGTTGAQQPAVWLPRLQHAHTRGRTAPAVRRPDPRQPRRLHRPCRRHSSSISGAAGDALSDAPMCFCLVLDVTHRQHVAGTQQSALVEGTLTTVTCGADDVNWMALLT